MDFQASVRARLLADAAITAEVGTRVYWGERPQADPLPAIVLTTVSDPRPFCIDHYQETRSTRVQLDVFAEHYGEALRIARAAISVLKDPAIISGKVFGAAFVDSQRDLSERVNGEEIHRQSVDLLLWHQGD